MTYGNYKQGRNMAWEVLIRHNISSLPVDLGQILDGEGIQICSYKDREILLSLYGLTDNMASNDGFSIKLGSKFFIFYNEGVTPKERQRFTIAHEMGHIFLGHYQKEKMTILGRMEYTTKNNGLMNEYDRMEFEANIFASRLLAPACILHELGITETGEIMKLCGLSQEAAKYRSERMKILENRNAWYKHPLETKVRNQFQEFINKIKCWE